MKKAAICAALLIVVLFAPGQAGAGRTGGVELDPALQVVLANADPAAQITVIVTLAEQADLAGLPGNDRAARQQEVLTRLQAVAQRSQRPLIEWLTGQALGLVGDIVPFWVFNGLAVTATPDVIRELARRAEVRSITPNAIDVVPAGVATYGAPEANLTVIHAPALWDLGWRGQGVVVASLDSGVDATHPDLASRWRGGSNSWYDPYRQHPTTPFDRTGHGTWTMGVMVGGDAGGTSVGVAPGAQWIAAKIFNDSGSATATAIHQAFQWVLDPDKNAATADAPDIVNNSWSYGVAGCNLEFQQDLRSLRAAGILPVFAAGNYGPSGSTSASPGNYPEAFAVGATDNNDAIYSGSSRGPAACGEASSVYPEVVAPGVNIRTTDLYGSYHLATGTSLSAPHVAGTLALLLSAYPTLTADQQAAALTNGALDLGDPGPDNTFGAGRIDALAAYLWLQGGGMPSPTATATQPAATSTPTAMPTAAATSTPTATAAAQPSATPTATATSTATAPQLTPTATATRTPTSTPAGSASVHSGDLDGSATNSGLGWTARVTVEIHDGGHATVSGAKVTGSWTGASGGTSCTTDATGRCTLSTSTVPKRTTSVTFKVSNISLAGYTYLAAANHDPDGDSDGTTITVSKP